MLLYFIRSDHTNNARWGLVGVSEMHKLLEEVRDKSEQGNFVVKCAKQTFVVKFAKQTFNQVDPDQSQKWLT